MKKIVNKIKAWFKHLAQAVAPGTHAVKGATLGLLVFGVLLWIVFSIRLSLGLSDPWVLLLSLAIALASVMAAYPSRGLLLLIQKIPKSFQLSMFMALPLLFIAGGHWMITASLFLTASLIGAFIFVLWKTGFHHLTLPKKAITILGGIISIGSIIVGGYLFTRVGFEMDSIENAAATVPGNLPHIQADAPNQNGPFEVATLTYGSGSDHHRPEFGEDVDITTDSVNGIPFIDNWEGFGGWWRTRYWGFDASSLPINARVWYPVGDGPFPLTLIVHGNHGMQDFSDPGYGYLGELLASQGIIVASVDENFINGSWSDLFGSLEKENDARAWLLLEHLSNWHEWNQTEGHIFYNKIDTSNLALIGHSRGGEAVAHAAFFNTLPYYPDDASIAFEYHYGIKSIIAIAPVDGQYEPARSRTSFDNVSYFVIHGSQDGDVRSYMGSQQYERISFTDSIYRLKAGLYVYGANHGQFNTSWGDNDQSFQWTGLLNQKQLLSASDQEQIAEVYIPAFLDVTLRNNSAYIPMFMDARTGKNWLPETIYLNQFEDSSFEPIATFDEDFDVTTLPAGSGKITTEHLTVWREQEIKLKWQDKGSRALYAGWHYAERDSIEAIPDSLVASYTLHADLSVRLDQALTFSMAESTESSNPKTKGKWVVKNMNKSEVVEENNTESKDEEIDKEIEDKAAPSLDFTILLTDSAGTEVSFPLSRFSPLQREIKVMIEKTDFITDDKESEQVFQTFYFPFEDIQALDTSFDVSNIKSMSFRFDQSKKGVVTIDDLGFMSEIN